MPYYHCRKCMHEFESYDGAVPVCDWCNTAKPILLEEKTPLEKMCQNGAIEKMLEKLNEKKGDNNR